tara:strand:- start:518 stop:676 length:159 start_codon:yes stop_codon:yes gene_type:complete
VEIHRKKKKVLNSKISQALEVSKDLTIKPPQLKQNPPKSRSMYPGNLYRNCI